MDPLSIGSAVVGLVAASSRICPLLYHFVTHTKDAPRSASQILDEMVSVTAALQQLQAYLTGASTGNVARRSLLSLRDIAATLMACVTTYSDLERIVGKCMKGGKVRRMMWLINGGDIGELVQRVQAHKLSLTLMLTVLQSESIQEAQNSVNRLTDLMNRLVAKSPDLQNRMNILEMNHVLPDPVPQSIGLRHSQPTNSFEKDLQTSKVYQRVRSGGAMWTPISSHRGSIATSMFSGLTDLSTVPVFNLPIWRTDISNAEHYRFGQCTLAVSAVETKERKSSVRKLEVNELEARPANTPSKPALGKGAMVRRGAIKRTAKASDIESNLMIKGHSPRIPFHTPSVSPLSPADPIPQQLSNVDQDSSSSTTTTREQQHYVVYLQACIGSSILAFALFASFFSTATFIVFYHIVRLLYHYCTIVSRRKLTHLETWVTGIAIVVTSLVAFDLAYKRSAHLYMVPANWTYFTLSATGFIIPFTALTLRNTPQPYPQTSPSAPSNSSTAAHLQICIASTLLMFVTSIAIDIAHPESHLTIYTTATAVLLSYLIPTLCVPENKTFDIHLSSTKSPRTTQYPRNSCIPVKRNSHACMKDSRIKSASPVPD